MCITPRNFLLYCRFSKDVSHFSMTYKPFWHRFVLQGVSRDQTPGLGQHTVCTFSCFLSIFSLHRWDLLFSKYGKKAFIPLLARFYKFICTRFREVGKHHNCLAMVKATIGSGRWIVLNIWLLTQWGKNGALLSYFICKFYLTATPAFNIINSYLA